MSSPRQILLLYPHGVIPTTDGSVARAAAALRDSGVTVEEHVIGENYDAVLDRLEQGAIPVVLKPSD